MASVKVAVRVRPFNEREVNMDCKCIIKMNLNKTSIVNLKVNDMVTSFSDQSLAATKSYGRSTNDLNNTQTNSNLSSINSSFSSNSSSNNSREKVKEFVYDASYWSFDPQDPHFISQSDVYNDLGKLTVNNAFDGYNACVCAYGQTGSGKSFSMMGQTDSETQEGLIPRICKNLFERVEKKRGKNETSSPSTQNTSYRAEVSYLEIYNEKVRDLLRSSEKSQENLKVREHPKTGVYVQGLSQHIVFNYSDIEDLLNNGNINRTTASTNMNDTSSRSHAIFTLKFSQMKFVENNIPSEIISKMNLVDLAGSERADSTGATGIRLKEGGNINKSLLTFINVISTLADLSGNPNSGKNYIPYRDSILTWLLKDSLGGNSKTVILAAISPADVNYVETMSTLRYANRAKNIINKPTINEDPNVKLIRELRNEIVHLKSLLGDNPTIDLTPRLSIDYDDQPHKNENQIIKEINKNQNEINEITNQLMSKWQEKNEHFFEDNENLFLERKRNNCLSLSIKNQPYLLSIDEAWPEILNGVAIYPLRHGKTLLGSDNELIHIENAYNSNKLNDLLLFGPGVKSKQCYLTRIDEKCFLCPLDGYCQLNNRVLNVAKEREINEDGVDLGFELKHGDLILLGDKNLFLFNNPCDLEEDSYLTNDHCQKRYRISHLIKQLATDSEKSADTNNENDIYIDTHENNDLRIKLEMSQSTMNELENKIKDLTRQNEASKREIQRLSDHKTNEIAETETVMSNSNSIDNQIEDQQTDSVSREFDQEDEIHCAIEKFEEDEKLLSECLNNLTNKSQISQLKSLLFELQNLKLKEEKFESDLKKSHLEIDKELAILNEKRDKKVESFNRLREMLHKDQKMIDLKLKMSELNTAELDIEFQIKECESYMEDSLDMLNSLNTELRIKKMYSTGGSQTLEELIEAEENTILEAKSKLEETRKSKERSYSLIVVEFEKARALMLEEKRLNNAEFYKLKSEVEASLEKEFRLKELLEDSLYENDEEKNLIENELAELIETRVGIENGRLKELTTKYEKEVNEKIQIEYEGLDELKKQDAADIKQDQERIHVLSESSTKRIQSKMKETEESIANRNIELKNLHEIGEVNRLKMNILLTQLEELEGKRFIEENKIFDSEMKLASEYKNATDKMNSQIAKLENSHRKKISHITKSKNLIQPKICNIVGPYKGIKLFNANFNTSSTKELSPDSSASRFRTLSNMSIDRNSFNFERKHNLNSSIQHESISSNTVLNSISSNASTISSSSDVSSATHTDDLLESSINKQKYQRLKFETNICRSLGISLEINDKPILCGKKLSDEHYEYLIEIVINDERWLILRRYSKIRQLHEQMSLIYPSLNCLVFPVRQLFNRELVNRQLQLEHYLRCFLEILLNDPKCPIYHEFMTLSSKATTSTVSNSSSLNSFSSSSSAYQSIYQSEPSRQGSMTKEKLCAFCPFFEQMPSDRSYLSKTQLTHACYLDRKNSRNFTLANHSINTEYTAIN